MEDKVQFDKQHQPQYQHECRDLKRKFMESQSMGFSSLDLEGINSQDLIFQSNTKKSRQDDSLHISKLKIDSQIALDNRDLKFEEDINQQYMDLLEKIPSSQSIKMHEQKETKHSNQYDDLIENIPLQNKFFWNSLNRNQIVSSSVISNASIGKFDLMRPISFTNNMEAFPNFQIQQSIMLNVERSEDNKLKQFQKDSEHNNLLNFLDPKYDQDYCFQNMNSQLNFMSQNMSLTNLSQIQPFNFDYHLQSEPEPIQPINQSIKAEEESAENSSMLLNLDKNFIPTQPTTRIKTEIKERQKDSKKKYRQSRHKNVFKNFGSALTRFIFYNQIFVEKVKQRLSEKTEKNVKSEKSAFKKFNEWLRIQIRLERKLDFVQGWSYYRTDTQEIKSFKDLFRELSLLFFEDYAMIYLMNSKKLDDLEIHLRSIWPFIIGINEPSTLSRFRPK